MTCEECLKFLVKSPTDCTTAERIAVYKHVEACPDCDKAMDMIGPTVDSEEIDKELKRLAEKDVLYDRYENECSLHEGKGPIHANSNRIPCN